MFPYESGQEPGLIGVFSCAYCLRAAIVDNVSVRSDVMRVDSSIIINNLNFGTDTKITHRSRTVCGIILVPKKKKKNRVTATTMTNNSNSLLLFVVVADCQYIYMSTPVLLYCTILFLCMIDFDGGKHTIDCVCVCGGT